MTGPWKGDPDGYPDHATAVVARFLGDSRLPYCSRATLRALLPAGKIYGRGNLEKKLRRAETGKGKTKNRATIQFQAALLDLEERRLIERGDMFVRVLDHQGLRDYAARRRSLDERWQEWITQAVRRVRSEIEVEQAPKIAELRRAELLALQRLMTDARGENWSGRGSVRFVPHGRAM